MTNATPIRLSASILAADFARLGAQVAEAEAAGVDAIHFDVMDGIFVPNISIGLPILEAVRRSTRLPIDVHLMIARPDDYLAEIVQAGANWVTVHVEGAHHLHRTLTHIRDLGAHPGVTLNPGTPPGALAEVLPMVDLVLVMTVNPGFGGQRFIEGQLPKIAALRAALDAIGSDAILSVDGGVGAANAARIVAAGATQLVAGSAIFHEEQSVAEAVRALRAAVGENGRAGEQASGR
ncbi:MAG: ribulose-phosphate 3-epimerase [Chloroflexia bacterium]